jgi:hypothetical protein
MADQRTAAGPIWRKDLFLTLQPCFRRRILFAGSTTLENRQSGISRGQSRVERKHARSKRTRILSCVGCQTIGSSTSIQP